MARSKNAKTPLQDLYTEATTELMFLRRAFRVLRENHPDFRSLPMPSDHRSEDALAEFFGHVKRIAEEARRKGGGNQADMSEVMPQYLGLGDSLPTIFNPVTMMDLEDED
jgi:hypothetical protein